MKNLSIALLTLTLVVLLAAGCTLATPEIPSPTAQPAPTTSEPTAGPTSEPPQSSPSPLPSPAPAPNPAPGTGMVKVYVTDPPPPEMDEIWVDIKSLEAHRTGGSWVTLAEDPGEFDLKALEDPMNEAPIKQFLASQVVETGKYTQLRFEVNSVRIVVGTDNFSAEVPSGKIKLVGTFEVTGDNPTEITLDFNGKESVLVTGKGKYMFKPVIKLLVEGGEEEPPSEPDELESSLGASVNATAELTTEKAYSGDESIHLETIGTEGAGNEARIVVPLPPGTTIGDLEAISWWVWTAAGYPPHVDIVLDINEDGVIDDEDMLTAEMAYNNADGIELDEGLTPTTDEWLQTFELAPDDGYGAVDNDTMLWITKLGAGNDDAPWGYLSDWKAGVVANDPGNDLPGGTTISGNAPLLRLELEIDNWVLQTEAYVDDIEVVIDGTTYTVSF